MKYKKIALIRGGASGEKEVSYTSAKAIEEALKTLNYEFEVLEADDSLFDNLKKLKPDVAFLATHGKYVEDGIFTGSFRVFKNPLYRL